MPVTLPDTYSLVIAAIDQIAQGHTKTAACEMVGVSVRTFNHVVKQDELLAELFEAAEDQSYDVMADSLVNISDNTLFGTTDPRLAAVVSKNVQWLLAHRRKKKYGEVVTVEHDIKADKEIIDALQRGRERAEGRLIEGEIVNQAPRIASRIVHDFVDVVVEDIEDDIDEDEELARLMR